MKKLLCLALSLALLWALAGCTPEELPLRSGRQLAVFGIDMQLHGDLDCRIVHLKRKDD